MEIVVYAYIPITILLSNQFWTLVTLPIRTLHMYIYHTDTWILKVSKSSRSIWQQRRILWLKKMVHLFKTPPKAHGIRTSHSWTRSSFGSMPSAPWKFTRLLVFSLWLISSGTLIPFGFVTAPVISLTAITFPPLSWMSLAAQDPTLPNPC